ASVDAYADLVAFGLLSSAATMVPCAWFPATAEFCRQHPQVDMGVHLTLTSEWAGYRWRPVSTCDPASGLLDEMGYFYPREDDVQACGRETAVYRELKAQIECALAAGIDATHIDTHMLAIFPTFVNVYLRLADEFNLPAFALRSDAAQVGHLPATADRGGRPLVDAWCVMSYDDHENRFEQAQHYLDKLTPGITNFLLHPAKDTPELRAIAPDWRTRVADYHLFTDERFRRYVQQSDIQVIGWRALKELRTLKE
ncbi:MAG: polysaccharide deacetylase family protein, partial [Anaerolineae bacterium]